MKRRDFIKKAFAVAAVAVVPFEVESEPHFKMDTSGPSYISDQEKINAIQDHFEKVFSGPDWQGFIIRQDKEYTGHIY